MAAPLERALELGRMLAMTEALQIRLLGELELSACGELLQLTSSKKTRALLGYLVLTGGRHTRSALCDLLWDGPADPRAAFRPSPSQRRPLADWVEARLVEDRVCVGVEGRRGQDGADEEQTPDQSHARAHAIPVPCREWARWAEACKARFTALRVV